VARPQCRLSTQSLLTRHNGVRKYHGRQETQP
jgi:hypothetical protein